MPDMKPRAAQALAFLPTLAHDELDPSQLQDFVCHLWAEADDADRPRGFFLGHFPDAVFTQPPKGGLEGAHQVQPGAAGSTGSSNSAVPEGSAKAKAASSPVRSAVYPLLRHTPSAYKPFPHGVARCRAT